MREREREKKREKESDFNVVRSLDLDNKRMWMQLPSPANQDTGWRAQQPMGGPDWQRADQSEQGKQNLGQWERRVSPNWKEPRSTSLSLSGGVPGVVVVL